MANKIDFRTLYKVNHRKFNIDSDGVTLEYDEQTNKYYITGSGRNVKHCILEILYGYGYQPLSRIFVKKKKVKKNDKEQANVSTNIDIINPMQTFGGWDNMSADEKGKYKSVSLKSSVTVSYFMPINTNACEVLKNQPVSCSGRETDLVVCDDNGNYYFTPEKMSETTGKSFEECNAWFKNQRKTNIANAEPVVSGVYELHVVIDMDKFCTYSLNDLHKTEEDEFIKNLISEGWSIVSINYEKYIRAPKEMRKKLFSDLVRAIHEFEFMSNNSSDCNPIVWLRSSFAVNNSYGVQNSSVAVKYFSKNENSFELYDDIDGVYSFTAPTIKSCFNTTNAQISIDNNAFTNSIKKLTQIGCELL